MYLDNVSLSNTSPGGHPNLISIQLLHSCYINKRIVTSHILFLFRDHLCFCSAIISPSNSAGPTPTIMIDMGRDAA